jgi:hypothetical protein
MDNLPFYLKTWGLPMLIVGLFYLVFLIPTYFLVKKYKPSYWLMLGMGILVVYLTGSGLFFLEIKTNFNRFIAFLFFSSFFSSFLFFSVFPLILSKLIKNKENNFKKIIYSYLFLFILWAFYVYLILITVSWGAASIIN